MSRQPWHFSPLHILLAKPALCSAISIQAADSQPSPLPSSALGRKSRLQRENVINSMERKRRLSIIHVPLCCYRLLSLSPPTPSDLAEAGSLSSSPCYLCLGLTSVFYRIATRTYPHTHTQRPTWVLEERRLSQLNPKYSDRLESSVVGAVRGEGVVLQEMEACKSTCRWLYK